MKYEPTFTLNQTNIFFRKLLVIFFVAFISLCLMSLKKYDYLLRLSIFEFVVTLSHQEGEANRHTSGYFCSNSASKQRNMNYILRAFRHDLLLTD